MTRKYISIHFWRNPPLEVSGVAQREELSPALAVGKVPWAVEGTEGQVWHRKPALGL